MANAVIWAADSGIKLLNISAGTYAPNITYLEDAINYANTKGVIIVAAAGNDNLNDVIYPAKYTSVISVGALNRYGQKADFTNYGSLVNIFAPGEAITSAAWKEYCVSTGTSNASAIVTGYASLLLSYKLNWTSDSIKKTFEKYGNFITGYYKQNLDYGYSLEGNTIYDNLLNSNYSDLAVTGFTNSTKKYINNKSYISQLFVKNMGNIDYQNVIIKGKLINNSNVSVELFNQNNNRIHAGCLAEIPIAYTINAANVDTGLYLVKICLENTDSNISNDTLFYYTEISNQIDTNLSIFNVRVDHEPMNDTDTIIVSYDICNTGNATISGLNSVCYFSPTNAELSCRINNSKVDSEYIQTSLTPGAVIKKEIKHILVKNGFDECNYFLRVNCGSVTAEKEYNISLSGNIMATHGADAHSYITEQAIKLLKSCGVNVGGIFEHYVDYSPIEMRRNPRLWQSYRTYEERIIEGNLDSDDEDDIVYNKGWPLKYDSHFWEADLGDYENGGINDDVAGTYDKVVKLFNGFNFRGKYPTSVIAEYKYNKGDSYYLLGQAVHLLQDMFVPAHVHGDSHGGTIFDGDEAYEDYHKSGKYLNYSAEKIREQGKKYIDPYNNNGGLPLRYLYYTANQISDYFASDDADGDSDFKRNQNGLHYDNCLQPIYDGFSSKNYPTVSIRLTENTYTYYYSKYLFDYKVECSNDVCERKVKVFDNWNSSIPGTSDKDDDLPSVGDFDLKMISDELVNYAIQYSAGLIYYFLVETKQQKKVGSIDITPILHLLLD